MKVLHLIFRFDESKQHEIDCVQRYAELSADEVVVFDVLKQIPTAALLDDVDAVICGGANAYRISQNDMKHQQELLAFIREIVDRGIPFLGLCYGAHALAAALGGTVEYRPQNKEVSTVQIYKLHTAEGDELFGDLPQEFPANCGRTDDIMELPVQCVPLANSDKVQFHAFRVAGKPVYATQFHAELGQQEEWDRMDFAFAHHGYFENMEELEQQKSTVEETPEATALLKKFIDRFVRK